MKHLVNRWPALAVLVVAALTFAGIAKAAPYPAKNINVICSSAAGGSSDLVTRALSERLSNGLHRSVVVLNVPGANGTIAAERVARATPDGYTLYSAVDNNLVVNPFLYKITYDPFRDFVPISMLARVWMVLLVAPNGPNTLQELIAEAKANPGKLNYASVGFGSQHHLGTQQFMMMTKTKLTHIPYKGTADAISALLGGFVQTEFAGVGFTKSLLDAGKVKALAIAAPHRSPLLPNVPTMAEAGLPGFDLSAWYAMLAPAKTPPEIIDRLSKAIKTAAADPGYRGRLEKVGLEVISNSPAEMLDVMRADTKKWKHVIESTGTRVVQ